MLPITKCLDVAEKIIQALDDPDINQKYFSLKEKILQDSLPQGQHLKQIRDENRLLQVKLKMLHEQINSHSEIENYMVQEMSTITKSIIPNSTFTSQTFTDSCKDLLDAYQTAFESHKFLRQKLVDTQNKLKDSLLNLKTSHSEEMDSIRRKRTLSTEEWKQKKIKLHDKMNDLTIKTQQIKSILLKLELENQQIQDDNSKAQIKSPKLKESLKQLENKGADVEMKRNRLLKEKSLLSFQLKKLRNEQKELGNLNDQFHISANPKVVINQLRLEIEKLEENNKKLKASITNHHL